MSNYLKQYFTKTQTPQSAPIPGTTQVANSAGGYAWAVSKWDRLKRFLVLGSEGGTYYITEQALTIENANNVLECLREDGLRVVNETVAISDAGRAPKNDPAIFVLALAAGIGDEQTRRAALDALPKVCRTGTHLFTFAEYVQKMRGWGRGLRRGVAGWYQALEPRALAYQVVKYRQRDGWTHTDLLRLAHPKPENDAQGALYNWVTRREEAAWARDIVQPENDAQAFIWAFERVQEAQDVETVVKLIERYDLPREALPTQWLNEARVWEALLAKMPMTAMIRNLASMSRVGLLTALSEAENTVVGKLTNVEVLRKARVHPIALLSALRVYTLGFSLRGQVPHPHLWQYRTQPNEWQPTQRIIDALDEAFYLAFQNVQPANKRIMLALDVSGSMTAGAVAGVPGLTPRDGSAAMALVTARTEPKYSMIAFSTTMVPFNISKRQRLDDVMKAMDGVPFGGTDCAQPMLYAMENKLQIDTFVIYTDSETWHGSTHPAQALWQYREKTGIPAQLIVVAMTGNKFSIADSNDPLMLDVVGFDSATPGLISDFARGEI